MKQASLEILAGAAFVLAVASATGLEPSLWGFACMAAFIAGDGSPRSAGMALALLLVGTGIEKITGAP